MTEDTNGASGSDQKPSGNLEGADDSSSTSKDTVAYETYKKVLSEKKKRDEELKAAHDELTKLRKAEKEKVEAELKAKEDYKKLLELEKNEKTEIKSKYDSLHSQIQEGLKFQHFLEALPGNLPKKFWKMVDTNNIIIDPETGEPDAVSVKKAAESFQAEFGELIVQQGKAKLPNSSAKTGNAPITKDLWDSMDPKQKKERLGEFVEHLKTQAR